MGDERFSPRVSIYKMVNGNPVLLPIKWKELSYVSTEKKADKCSLTFLNDQLIYPDDPTFDCGAELAVSWGYPGNMSPLRNVIVQKSELGEVEVAAIDPVASMQAISNPELVKAAEVVRAKLARAIDRLRQSEI